MTPQKFLKGMLGNDDAYQNMIFSQLETDPGAEQFFDEVTLLSETKDKEGWFYNHPMIEMANLNAQKGGDTKFSSMSPKIMKILNQTVESPHGATKSLINKLSLNQDFVRMFSVNPTFQSASLKALQSYNDSIQSGPTSQSAKQGE